MTLGKDEWNFPEVDVVEGMKNTAAVDTDAHSFRYLMKDTETAECKVEMAKKLTAPIETDMVVGTISYELDGNIIEQFRIYTIERVEKATFGNKVKKWIRNLQDFVENLINK